MATHPQLAALREQVRAASADGTPLVIEAGGSKAFYGPRCAGARCDPRGYSGIVDYEPTELVITARCGTPLAEVEAALAGHRQMLPFEPPHFADGGARATIGGMVAAGLAGPRRAAAGSVRDYVLGATLLDGRGEVLSFGGRVMKNVAGYDMARTLAGSLGTLGVLLDVSLKVLPRPPAERTLRFELDEATAIRRLNEWGGQPLPVSGSAWCDGVLRVRLSGAPTGIDAAHLRMGGAVVDASTADAAWTELREQQHAFFAPRDGVALWRIAVPPTTPPLGLGRTLIEWNGGQRWLVAGCDAATAARMRDAAAAVGGHATRFRGGDNGVAAFHPLPRALAALNMRLKQAFDPAGIFNVGGLHGVL